MSIVPVILRQPAFLLDAVLQVLRTVDHVRREAGVSHRDGLVGTGPAALYDLALLSLCET